MIVRPPRLSRRTLLRAAGVSIALPLLEAMWPRSARASAPKPPVRTAFIYLPNGIILPEWTPATTGRDFQLTPSLAPLAPVKDKILAISGLNRTYVSGTQVHGQCAACWMTSSPPSQVLDGGFPTNATLDQIIARQIGQSTTVPSLELSCNDFTDNHETRYFESISWLAPGFAANTEKNPRAVFDRLFGGAQGLAEQRSILDTIQDDAKSLRNRLGVQDQRKLDEYLESIRATEKRVKVMENSPARNSPPPIQPPTGIPSRRSQYIQLMGELITLAFQQDLCRTATLLIDPERWDTPRVFDGVFDTPQNHHALTHTKGKAAKEKIARIDRFHVQQFAAIVQRMAAIPEGDSTLLDNSMIIMGSGLSDGDIHSYTGLPALIAGSGGGILKTGRHLDYQEKRPLADLWLSVLHTLGIDRKSFADSTSPLPDLTTG